MLGKDNLVNKFLQGNDENKKLLDSLQKIKGMFESQSSKTLFAFVLHITLSKDTTNEDKND